MVTKIKASNMEITPVPKGGIVLWAGTYTTIPAGFEICDGAVSTNDPTYTKPNLLGNKFLRQVPNGSTNPDLVTARGAASHTHTATAHTHVSGGPAQTHNGSSIGNVGTHPDVNHTHTSGTSSVVTLDAYGSVPYYTDCIPIVYTKTIDTAGARIRKHHIKTDGWFPRYSIIFWSDILANVPVGWQICDGSVANGIGTPNLHNRFMKGVPSSGTGPGATGGSDTHSHTESHSHTTSSDGGGGLQSGGGYGVSSSSLHNHTYGATAPTISGVDHNPPHVLIVHIMFIGYGSNAASYSGAKITNNMLNSDTSIPRGIVVAYFGGATAPTGWSLCDGGGWINGAPSGYSAGKPQMLSRMARTTLNSVTDGGNIGGEPTHTHTGGAHTHPAGTNQSAAHPVWECSGCGIPGGFGNGHNHSGVSSTMNVSTGSIWPLYTELVWIVRD